MFEVRLTSRAEHAYLHEDSRTQKRFDKVLELLENGDFWHPNIRPLRGPFAGSMRYRMGDWKIIFKSISKMKSYGSKPSPDVAAHINNGAIPR